MAEFVPVWGENGAADDWCFPATYHPPQSQSGVRLVRSRKPGLKQDGLFSLISIRVHAN
ncbi:hypothetical protein PNH50_18355 [Leisingera aquaemixtae]|jgi:hypothetical protein|uniref:hypothetical protein n=1 Tax=Leisingera aquaemixtae TaxID=1396826 RepID=UPI0021A6320B|nr:hypothetical protein [Leisingera aquaemixtae]UWQ24860.1 hypothetical protein K3553_18265 [Leisingera aquaemixtae]